MIKVNEKSGVWLEHKIIMLASIVTAHFVEFQNNVSHVGLNTP